ncbi:MAG: glutamine amidotransferase [Gemmatimonas sp. SG8_23]|nr:MAG: glutamine amidotransferase [Gemmatimonas sp. SG8_23]
MCRWLAYSGNPVPLSSLIFETRHSLIDQSLAARQSEQTTNGDGFGVGWYDHLDEPGLYKDIQPAWNDDNLQDVCRHVVSPLFVAHVRATTGTPVQQTNCHPFRRGRWLFVHNGLVSGFESIRWDLVSELGRRWFGHLKGTTDSEIMFYLCLHFGLEEDPYGAVARMVGFVERVGMSADVAWPMQMTLGISDGMRLFAVLYSSEGRSRTLYHSEDIAALRRLLPRGGAAVLDAFSDDARMVVSEPLGDELPGAWKEIPEATFLAVEEGRVETRGFVPARV